MSSPAGQKSSKRRKTAGANGGSSSETSTDRSSALSQLLGISAEEFFSTVWEKEPRVFRRSQNASADSMKMPLAGFGDLLGVLRNAKREGSPGAPCHALVLRDGCPTTEYPSLATAYLDGCSVVVNNAQMASEELRQLCIQLRGDMPHAYTQLYLTPPRGQAVAAHADDRDVLVWQAAGSKSWRVYGSPPIRFPYPEEQVGKSEEHPVPETTLQAEPLLDLTLNEGDVLYIPRGFVHEAFTNEEAASLHITIALATYDWSWPSIAAHALVRAGLESAAAEEATLPLKDATVMRRSMPPALICTGASEAATSAAWVMTEAVADAVAAAAAVPSTLGRNSPDAAGESANGVLTAESLQEAFAVKVAMHNSRQDSLKPSATRPCLLLSSFVRRLTEEEKSAKERGRRGGKGKAGKQGKEKAHEYDDEGDDGEEGEEEEGQQQQGLLAREEIAEALLSILGGLTTEPARIVNFADAPLLCPFSKLCFAQVCVDLGLLCVCDSEGKLLPS